jgi:DNA-binding transcriptional MerR regulator
MPPDDKSASAFRTIGEVAEATGVAPHILRYWEGRFPQLRPVTRAGKRRYYRPEDVALVERIDRLLNREGYTIRGVQQLLAGERRGSVPAPEPRTDDDLSTALRDIRDRLREALDSDG